MSQKIICRLCGSIHYRWRVQKGIFRPLGQSYSVLHPIDGFMWSRRGSLYVIVEIVRSMSQTTYKSGYCFSLQLSTTLAGFLEHVTNVYVCGDWPEVKGST